jgi:adenylate cyclase
MPRPDLSLEVDAGAARTQLERVVASPGFSRNERLTRFLRFVVERHLAGRADEIKESVIAIEVFGRTPDHDPKQVSLIRTEASRLRARLNEYYLGEGKADPLVIDLPKGGYVPAFRQPAIEPAKIVPETALPLTGSKTPPGVTIPRRRLRWEFAVALMGIAAATGIAWSSSHRQHAPISIAVLPLTTVSQNPGDEYFTDGLTDQIIQDLSIIDGLAVRSQTSSFALKGKPRDIREAGRLLNADYILEGSVLRAGPDLRINTQLIRARDDSPVWSGHYQRQLADVLAIQDEISHGIVNSLRLKLGRGRRRYEVSADVYDLYLRARSMSVERGLFGVNNNIGRLEEVIGKDPSFAPAWADLAAAYALRSGQFRFDIPGELARMRAAAQKAVQLDPLLALAQYAQAMAYARDAQWEQAETSFRKAIELDPNRAEPHREYSMSLLLPLGRNAEALTQQRAAESADPLSPFGHFWMAYVLIADRRYNEAEPHCAPAGPELAESDECLGRVRLGQGRIDEAILIFEAALKAGLTPGSDVRGELGYAYGRAGRREDALKFEASTPEINPFNHALIFAGLGDKDRTLEALDRAAKAGPIRIGRELSFPEMSFLRGDPRVALLRIKVGLPKEGS